MSRTYRKQPGGAGRNRRINARAVRRNPPDLRLLSKALLMQAADEAAALREAAGPTPDESSRDGSQDHPDASRKDAS